MDAAIGRCAVSLSNFLPVNRTVVMMVIKAEDISSGTSGATSVFIF